MATSKAALINHPVRARLILAIMGQALTTQQITMLLPDVRRTSLYRHIRELVEADVLTVVDEKRIRGTVERTYAVRPRSTLMTPQEVSNTGHGEYFQMVASFLEGLTSVFRDYLAKREADLPREVFLRTFPLYLTADEFQTLRQQLLDVLAPLQANEPTPERSRRIICLQGVPGQPDSSQVAVSR